MALASVEGARLRRVLLWVALVGVAVAIVLFIGGSLVGTALTRPQPVVTTGTVEVFAANDADANSLIDRLDPSEHPVPSAEVRLTGTSGTVETGTTDPSGRALLADVPAGSYAVGVFIGAVQVSAEPSKVQVTGGVKTSLDLALNAAGANLGAIEGRVWRDTNGNGTVDATDVGVNDVPVSVTLYDEDVAETVTDEKGSFTIAPLEPGRYDVYCGGALPTTAIVRSRLDRPSLNCLLSAEKLLTVRPIFRLVQASLSPGLEVVKLASDADEIDQEFVRTAPGSGVSFRITVRALGTSSDTYPNVVAVDAYPAEIDVSAVAGGGTDDGRAITWSIGTMTGGQQVELTYDGTVSISAPEGSLRNVVTVTSPDTPTVEDDSTVLVRSGSTAATGGLAEVPGSGSTVAVTPSTPAAQTTSRGSTSISVGVPGWAVALAASVPLVAITAVVVVGLRRARP